MSTEYFFACAGCQLERDEYEGRDGGSPTSSGGMDPRGPDDLHEVVDLLVHLEPLLAAGWSGMTNGMCVHMDWHVRFAIRHKGCAGFQVRDEYGGVHAAAKKAEDRKCSPNR